MPRGPLWSALPTAVKSVIDATSWNAIQAAAGGGPLYSGLPTSVKHFIDQIAWDAVVNSVPATIEAATSLDFPSIPSGEHRDLTMTVTGAVVGRPVFLGAPAALEDGLSVFCWVSAANTVKVRVTNMKADGTEVNPASGVYTVLVFVS